MSLILNAIWNKRRLRTQNRRGNTGLRAPITGMPLTGRVDELESGVLLRRMRAPHLHTKNLSLILQTREDVLAYLGKLSPHERMEISPVWLALLDGSSSSDPWIHGFVLVHGISGAVVGQCGFKGPPAADGAVEIAYGVSPEHQGKGYATEAAAALVSYAWSNGQVRLVRAHTLPQSSGSARVLMKCGFLRVGEVMDPEDGLVWRWERPKEPDSKIL